MAADFQTMLRPDVLGEVYISVPDDRVTRFPGADDAEAVGYVYGAAFEGPVPMGRWTAEIYGAYRSRLQGGEAVEGDVMAFQGTMHLVELSEAGVEVLASPAGVPAPEIDLTFDRSLRWSAAA
ncbi:MAG: hypothetical protein QNJ13_08185 [Paracoccaceae bacterium]|nr:hypothetical protein [Paracoccaceae bacterium]